MPRCFLFPILLSCGLPCIAGEASTLSFAGYEWTVREDEGGPGPNVWDARNVWVDDSGFMHLRVALRDGKWTCAEVYLTRNMGFGRYEWQLVGRPDLLDDNLVLGLFNYTRPGLGPDGTNEIDIEFATWGGQQEEHGNWTVYPFVKGPRAKSFQFPFTLTGDFSTHRFTWSPQQVYYQSFHGHEPAVGNLIKRWRYIPGNSGKRIPQKPLPVHMNLWLFEGKPPTDGKDVEIVVSGFKFTPAGRR